MKVEQLERREKTDYIYQETNYHEEVYLLGFLKRSTILHSVDEFDLKNNILTMKIDNQQPATDLLGIRSKFKTLYIASLDVQLNPGFLKRGPGNILPTSAAMSQQRCKLEYKVVVGTGLPGSTVEISLKLIK